MAREGGTSRRLSGTASLLKEVLLSPRFCLMILIPVSRPHPLLPLIHCHSSAASRQNRRLSATSFSSRHYLKRIPRRTLTGVPAPTYSAFLSCRHSRQNSSCMAATPTLLTRRGRQRDARTSADRVEERATRVCVSRVHVFQSTRAPARMRRA